MKKLVSVLFALLFVGSFAFAEVNVGAWGRFLYAPTSAIAGDIESEDNFAFTAPNWGGRGRVGVNFSGTSDNVGFNLNIDSNGNTLGVGDQAKIWVKVNEMFQVQLGRIQGDVLRGKIDDSSFLGALSGVSGDFNMVQTTTGKNDIFKRFEPNSGILVDITPAEGVYLGVALDAQSSVVLGEEVPVTTEDMLKKIQVGGGYVIADLGHLRAQYIGGLEDAAKYFQVAFAYTAMEGLVVDAGVKYQMESKAGKSNATVHATYSQDALAAIARASVKFGEAGTDDELGYSASADVAYTVADPLAVGAELSFAKEGDPVGLTVLPYAKLGYGQGYMKAGFEFSSFTKSANGDYTTWALPIIMEYWF